MKIIIGLKAGFTLIEMVVVVGIIVMLTVLSLPEFNGIGEKNDLRNAAEAVRQAIVEARADSMAPKTENTRTYNLYEVRLVAGISSWTDNTAAGAGNGTVGTKDPSGVDEYPVTLRAAIIPCDKSVSEAISSTDLKKIDLPDHIMIKEFDPDTPGASFLGTTMSGTGEHKYASIQFTTTSFNMSCGNKGVNDPAWSGKDVLKVTMQDRNIKNNQQPEELNIFVNKYSGQVWVSQEGTSGASRRVVLPARDDFLGTSAADILDRSMPLTGCSTLGGAGDDTLISSTLSNQAAVIGFKLNGLPSGVPKKARLWVTPRNVSGTGVQKYEVYLTDLKDASENIENGTIGLAACDHNAGDLDKLIGTMIIDGTNNAYRTYGNYKVDINIRKVLSDNGFLDAGGGIESGKILTVAIVPKENNQEANFYSSEALSRYMLTGLVDQNGETLGKSVSSGSYLELIY